MKNKIDKNKKKEKHSTIYNELKEQSMSYRSKYHFLAQKKMLPLVGIYENQMISKGLKTNYFAPTKIHIQYK